MYDFGNLDELVESDSKRTAARWVAGGLGAVFLALSAMTTGLFFMTYAPGLGDMFGPVAGPWVAALIGVICLDAAALLWSFVRSHGCDSHKQMILAGGVGAVDLIMSLTTSALYILLSGNRLDAGVRDAAGGLSEFGQALHLTGVLIITLSLVLNFAAVWLFGVLSSTTRAAAQRSELAATQREAAHVIQTMHTREAVKRSIGAIAAELPSVAQSQADHNAARYVSTMRPSSPQPAAPYEPVAHANGSGPAPRP